MRAALTATAIVVAGLALSTTVLQAYSIPTPSMEATLEPGDHLIVNKLAHRFERGELIVFRYPEDNSQTFIKRVIGLPGDRIRLENKQLILNGSPLVEDYAIHRTAYTDEYRDNFPPTPALAASAPHSSQAKRMLATARNALGEIVVPEGAYFVLGDNRDISLDGRYFGFVSQNEVIGRPWFIYWSYDSDQSRTRWDRTFTVPSSPSGK